jgi:hypothetical protein
MIILHMRDWRYSSTYSISVLDGGDVELHALVALQPGKESRVHNQSVYPSTGMDAIAKRKMFAPTGNRTTII